MGPLPARADSSASGAAPGNQTGSAQAAYAPIVITEMQAGSTASASEEFIELYNQSAQAIDLTAGHWQVQVASSKASSWASPLRTISLAGNLGSGEYYLLASNYQAPGASGGYLNTAADATFSAGLSAESGHVRVVYTASPTSGTTGAQVIDDELEWTTTTGSQMTSASIDNRAPFVLSAALVPGSSLKRVIHPDGTFADTDTDSADFVLSLCPSPTTSHAAASGGQGAVTSEPHQASASDSNLPTAPVATVVDAINQACAAPPSGSTQSTGDSATDGVSPPQVEPPVAEPDQPSQADGAPLVSQPTMPADDVGLMSPQITELLPNPAAPQTDAADEFVELYNGNAQPFDVSGFALETGAKAKHHYIFPSGTMLPSHGFVAYFSGTTGIALSNASGQVSLLDPFGSRLDETDPYGTAKEGQAWALAYGAWQWTTTPTPNAPNAIKMVSSSASKAKSGASSTKAVTARATAGSKKAAKSPPAMASGGEVSGVAAADTPLHPGVLAAATLFAVLYGAYEYRADVANRINQLRKYRAYRRERRPSLAWWRGD